MASNQPNEDEIMYIDDDDEEEEEEDSRSSSNASLSKDLTQCRNPAHHTWSSNDMNYKSLNSTPPAAIKIFQAFGYRRQAGDRFCVSCINRAMFLPEEHITEILCGKGGSEKGDDPAQKSRRHAEQAQIRAQLDKLELSEMDEEEKANQMKQLRMLAFVNPGKFMEDFDPETSAREMKKMNRRINAEKNMKKNQMYDEFGVFMNTGKNVCDCLVKDCPGCHFPCPKCRSTKCGADCRCNRRWVYDQIEIEGTGKTLSWSEG